MADYQLYDDILKERLNDLLLPNEDMAWEDMRRRLEEKKRRRFFIWWRPGCAIGILAIVFLSTALYFTDPFGWFRKSSGTSKITVEKTQIELPASTPDTNSHFPPENYESHQRKAEINDTGKAVKIKLIRNDELAIQSGSAGVKTKNRKHSNIGDQDYLKSNDSIVVIDTRSPVPGIAGINQQDTVVNDSLANPADIKQPIDSILKKDTSKKTKPPVADTKVEKERTIFLSAGLGLYQQLPVDGQSLTPYSASGRKGSISDYLPSVFLRINKKDKWFIHSGFRYGAPQQTREPIYRQTKFLDTVGVRDYTNTTSFKLKKTFYHQVPLSFHLQITPFLNIGTGVVWNKFHSAVAEREEILTHNVTLVDSLLSRTIVRERGDSIFSSSYFQLLFETQLRHKRFELGVRYSLGLQPYLQFQLPGGLSSTEKNSSLQLFLRYELWRQKTKEN